jgi:peptidoglycan/LPS O-acetylase OafA/YrhL
MKRLEYLDSLRGLTALYVLVYHLAKMPPMATGLPGFADRFVLFGGSGVILFFVISAFCLCLTMPARDVGAADVTDFYAKRFFRIAPLFYAVVAMTCLRNYLVRDIVPPGGDVLANATFTFNLVPGMQDSLVFAGWTIGVEMLFYLVFPVLIVLLRGLTAKVAALIVAGLAFPLLLAGLAHVPALTDFDRERYALLTVVRYLPAFILGMIAFQAVGGLRARQAASRIGAGCLAVGALIFAAAVGGYLTQPASMPVLCESVSFTLMLVGLALWPVRLVVNRITQFLGRISYSVYLLHGPVILLINRPVFPRIEALGLPQAAAFGLSLAVTLAITLVVSWIAYRMVERPGIAFGRRLIAAREARAVVAAQPG